MHGDAESLLYTLLKKLLKSLLCVQVLRVSVASFGFVYGGVKLGYLKVIEEICDRSELATGSNRNLLLLQTKAAAATKKQQATGDQH